MPVRGRALFKVQCHALLSVLTCDRLMLRFMMRIGAYLCSTVFFLRLPFDHHGPVSELSQSNLYTLCCTGPFNWGEAHCAGEKVKQTNRTISKEVS